MFLIEAVNLGVTIAYPGSGHVWLCVACLVFVGACWLWVNSMVRDARRRQL
jgi:hypothetical protein